MCHKWFLAEEFLYLPLQGPDICFYPGRQTRILRHKGHDWSKVNKAMLEPK